MRAKIARAVRMGAALGTAIRCELPGSDHLRASARYERSWFLERGVFESREGPRRFQLGLRAFRIGVRSAGACRAFFCGPQWDALHIHVARMPHSRINDMFHTVFGLRSARGLDVLWFVMARGDGPWSRRQPL